MTIRALVRMLQLQRSTQPAGRRQPMRTVTVEPSFTTIPMWQLVAIRGMAAIYTAWLLWVLEGALPEYFTLATQGVPFDRIAIVVTIQLLLIAVALCCFGDVLRFCGSEMRRRVFK